MCIESFSYCAAKERAKIRLQFESNSQITDMLSYPLCCQMVNTSSVFFSSSTFALVAALFLGQHQKTAAFPHWQRANDP